MRGNHFPTSSSSISHCTPPSATATGHPRARHYQGSAHHPDDDTDASPVSLSFFDFATKGCFTVGSSIDLLQDVSPESPFIERDELSPPTKSVKASATVNGNVGTDGCADWSAFNVIQNAFPKSNNEKKSGLETSIKIANKKNANVVVIRSKKDKKSFGGAVATSDSTASMKKKKKNKQHQVQAAVPVKWSAPARYDIVNDGVPDTESVSRSEHGSTHPLLQNKDSGEPNDHVEDAVDVDDDDDEEEEAPTSRSSPAKKPKKKTMADAVFVREQSQIEEE
eukprot:CAMPEP_0172302516 /NCGR_PEP_ID=MMETSP1058-20130122/4217_1 /TAXON_ID=83371 /ORGANISM="Detonula confervacea, Strain CCMP 353" /LENGTH=279 /DNA_ID=CAMNT_0013013029 /DNA_START=179 /DNA_END=1015 /DNA_ORIENTATION=+